MNPLLLYTTIYNHLGGDLLPYWTLTPLRRFVRKIANYHLEKWLNRRFLPTQQIIDGLYVSFTSFPARINNVWKVVESIKHQTILPEKILLWLSKDQFSSEYCLPEKLRSIQDELFEIRFVEGDLRSHKKYIYACREFYDKLLFLIDDDIFYSPDIIEKSLSCYRKYPGSIICNYGCQITYDENGHHLPYKSWRSVKNDADIFFGSGGGTLFCPAFLYKDLTDEDIAIKLTPTADDIWLNAMARLAGVKIHQASSCILLPVINKNDKKLSQINNDCCQNDIQIEAVEDHYGKCFDKIIQ